MVAPIGLARIPAVAYTLVPGEFPVGVRGREAL